MVFQSSHQNLINGDGNMLVCLTREVVQRDGNVITVIYDIMDLIHVSEPTFLGSQVWEVKICQAIDRFLREAFQIPEEECLSWKRKELMEAVESKGVDDVMMKQLESLIESKCDMLFSPLHASGYILDPKYFGIGQSKDKTIMRAWKATVDSYESDSATRRLLREQLSSYWRLAGPFGKEDAVDCRDKIDPVAWWENFGFETPDLQALAIKILSQVFKCFHVSRGLGR